MSLEVYLPLQFSGSSTSAVGRAGGAAPAPHLPAARAGLPRAASSGMWSPLSFQCCSGALCGRPPSSPALPLAGARPPPPDKDLESPSSTRLEALVPYRDSIARTRSPSRAPAGGRAGDEGGRPQRAPQQHWKGEGETCPLNHCLSWSKALPPPLPQRTCGAGGKTECHAFGVGPKPCPRGPVEQEARPSATPSSLQVLGMVSCTALAGCRAGP